MYNPTDYLNSSIESDPELHTYINEEFSRQKCGLELIASENFTSTRVMQCLGSILTNKYSEGLPGKRYYGGNEIIDKIEQLCIDRALKAFNLSPSEWGVNVQPYSGSIANFAVYNALLKPNDKIMGLDLPSGGHLSHGFKSETKKISTSSIYFDSMSYKINESGYIDYEQLEKDAIIFKPKLIMIGYSAYSRDLNYELFKKIADINKSYLVCDMAHFNGFVVSGLLSNPFKYCDIVTSTTHKTLGGPRSGLIFFKTQYKDMINFSVFPSIQGGPHENQISALATQLKFVISDEYKNYMKQVQINARVLSSELIKYGYKILTNGTDNHMVLCDLREKKISGTKIQRVCEYVGISINKNTVIGDKSALNPGGIRLGTSALTTRGFIGRDFEKVSYILHEIIMRCIQKQESCNTMKTFMSAICDDVYINKLKTDISQFASSFPFYMNT
jgi:glycine hydroxymethyltransferase